MSGEAGFRCAWLARLTRGRVGLGRWTRGEVDAHRARATEMHEAVFSLAHPTPDADHNPREEADKGARAGERGAEG